MEESWFIRQQSPLFQTTRLLTVISALCIPSTHCRASKLHDLTVSVRPL